MVYVEGSSGPRRCCRSRHCHSGEPFPTFRSSTSLRSKSSISDQIGQLLNFLFALLVLAVLIALLGIVNTLR